MPAAPLYVHRLESAIDEISRLPAEWVDRSVLQEILGVSKWTAWRLLKRCGAGDGPGGALVCRRDDLLVRLRALREDGRIGPEIARRNRVEEYLEGLVRSASRRHKEIATHQAAADLFGTRFAKLPAGVDLQPGELRIQFSGSADFLRKFGAVVFALNNDYEQISEFLDAAVSSPNRAADRADRAAHA